jgi:2-desacetyl-2-hydroxyethyl bacteriochlorophyllide A dehydrogenase
MKAMKSVNIVFPRALEVAVKEEEVGEPSGGEVLIEARASLVSPGTELRCLEGRFDKGTNWSGWVQYPFKPGYSMAGTVAKTGKDVSQFKPGDRIVAMLPHSQYSLDSVDNLVRVPEQVSWEEAAWQPLGMVAQIGVRRAKVHLGDLVGVIGAGALGQLVIQYVRLCGARAIIAIDPREERLDFAKRNGARHCLAMPADKAVAEIRALTTGRMLDVVFDVTGLPMVLSAATQMVRRMGKVVLLGDNTMPSQQFLGPNVVSDSISIIGAHGNNVPVVATQFNPWTWKEMAGLFFELLMDKRLDVLSLTTSRRCPRDAQDVYSSLRNQAAGQIGIIFDWSLLA